MNSTDFSVDRRDIKFVQKEFLQVQNLTKLKAFEEFSEEDFYMVVNEGITFVEEVFAPINKTGDEQGSQKTETGVKTPEGFKEAWKRYGEEGWMGITSPPEFGGQGLPLSVAVGVSESLFGGNPSLYVVCMLTAGSSGLIESFGSEEQKALYCEKMISGTWGGTMCLSESDAGSAVGDITTRAKKSPEGDHYLIEGAKQWISGGDHDMTENIIHLVLARTEGALPGPKGISLFIVPKYRLDSQGKPGEDNGVSTVRVEHKLGIKASPTCALEFGSQGPTHGYLLEGENRGMAQMFKLMNEARLTVAYQGLGSGSGAYRNTLAYARDRIQGIPIEMGKDQSQPRKSIVHHPDVRNSLLTMKALVEGARGIIYSVAFYKDMADHGPDDTRGYYQNLVDFLIPIAKNYGADQGFEAVRLGVQVLGGVGYTEEFPLAQTLRDTKIASIYEGTTGIQALDLVTRKLNLGGGQLFETLMEEIGDLAPVRAGTPALAETIANWEDYADQLRTVASTLAHTMDELGPRAAVLNATDVTVFFGDVMAAYYLLKMALIAEKALEPHPVENWQALAEENEEICFYFNKIKTAEHYVYHVMPRSRGVLTKLQSQNYAALEAVF